MQSQLGPGAMVWIRQRRWHVHRLRRFSQALRLEVVRDGERVTFIAPFDRPDGIGLPRRCARATASRAMAVAAAMLARAWDLRSPQAAVTANVALLPYQLEPVLASLAGVRRILIADEVGLGKTVQAALVIAETARRHPEARILAAVPATLRDQWFDELTNRFGLRCTVADRTSLDDLARAGVHGDNPWRRPGLWIASLDFLKQPQVRDALPPLPWDLVVLDEAHTASGASDRHHTADAIARTARRLVLLTATPHSGDTDRFDRLTRLGALAGLDDAIAVFRRTRTEVDTTRARRVAWHRVRLSAAEVQLLAKLRDFERATLSSAGVAHREAALLVLSVFRKRALSSAAAVASSLERRLEWLDACRSAETGAAWIQPSLDLGGEDDELSGDERAGLQADTGVPPYRERSWLRRLLDAARQACRVESKLTRLAALLRRSPEQVIVFTEFRRSLEAAAARLEPIRPLATLHGGQTASERRDQLARFQTGAATVLLATDVAGLGLNLQSRARWVVSLELPWNPARLEQRLGRVDRIGQQRPVHLTLLIARHEAESDLLARLARRTLLARQTVGRDTLTATAPSETHLRGALLAGEGLSEPDAAPMTLCRRWVRPARRLKRSMERKRRLGRLWRGDVDSARVLWAATPSSRWVLPGHEDSAVLVFEVPILAGSGDILEQHVVLLQAQELRSCRGLTTTWRDIAGHAAAARLEPRARRVRRLVDRHRRQALVIERAIVHHITGVGRPAVVQPGLFDGRALRALAATDSDREVLQRGLDAVAAEAGVEVGTPVLRVVFVPRESRRRVKST